MASGSLSAGSRVLGDVHGDLPFGLCAPDLDGQPGLGRRRLGGSILGARSLAQPEGDHDVVHAAAAAAEDQRCQQRAHRSRPGMVIAIGAQQSGDDVDIEDVRDDQRDRDHDRRADAAQAEIGLEHAPVVDDRERIFDQDAKHQENGQRGERLTVDLLTAEIQGTRRILRERMIAQGGCGQQWQRNSSAISARASLCSKISAEQYDIMHLVRTWHGGNSKGAW
jgi:hypothetical protein